MCLQKSLNTFDEFNLQEFTQYVYNNATTDFVPGCSSDDVSKLVSLPICLNYLSYA